MFFVFPNNLIKKKGIRCIKGNHDLNAVTLEKLDWFKTINIAGEKLTDQELRNAIYTGTWLTDAKRHFSKTNCPAYNIAKDYIKGVLNRQDYLETAISWISDGKIEDYMAKHQHDKNANELWEYFQNVVAWTREIFPNFRREMSNVPWGLLYNQFKGKKFDSKKLEKEITELMQDEDVTKKSGIYPYVLTRQENHLSIRMFNDKSSFLFQRFSLPFEVGVYKSFEHFR